MIEMNIVRGILTLLLILAFITLVVWLYSKRNQHAYEDAARLPLQDDQAIAASRSENPLS
jgi:cytochrome c oxidase cbb3-type subunit 4